VREWVVEGFVKWWGVSSVTLVSGERPRRRRYWRTAADATGAPQSEGFLCSAMKFMIIIITFCPFPSNGAPTERN
jgi:hypothetical protein